MTNKELISKIREEILHLKMKELQRTNGVNTGADVYLSSYAVLSILSNALTEESEDERIRKELIFFLKEEIPQCSIKEHANKLKEFVAWLEKQKYDRMKPIYDARESFESALEKAWNDYHNGYENVDKLEDDYVECAHAKGFREGYLFGIEKQKEQVTDESDKVAAAYQLGRSDERKQKEQKELPLMDGNADLYFDEWNQQKQNPTKRQCFEEGIRYARRLQKEQKPVVTHGETYHVDTLGTQQVIAGKMPQKAAWSEEEEKIISNIRHLLFGLAFENGGVDVNGDYCKDVYIQADDFLKSLRPSWKPSEEQMDALQHAIDACESEWDYQDDELRSLLNDIKKL